MSMVFLIVGGIGGHATDLELVCSKSVPFYLYSYTSLMKNFWGGGVLYEKCLLSAFFLLVEFVTHHVHVVCNKRNRGDKASVYPFSKHLLRSNTIFYQFLLSSCLPIGDLQASMQNTVS